MELLPSSYRMNLTRSISPYLIQMVKLEPNSCLLVISLQNVLTISSLDPLSNSDFSTLVPGTDFPEIEPGHECYSVPNPPSSIVAGANATLQLSYTSSFDTSTNQTYYACADIRYVALSDFTTSIPCFNVTEDTPYTTSAAGVASTATSSSSSSSLSSSSSSHSGLSRGAIAGIVVGSIVGAAMLAALLFLLYRAHVRKLRRDIVVQLRMHDLTNAHKPMTAPSDTSGEHH